MTTSAGHRRSHHLRGLSSSLPGANLVEAGMASLERGEHTAEALLVALAAARLRALGLNVPEAADRIAAPNLALYAAVRDGGGDYFDYNALLGRLSSFADAAECLLRGSTRENAAERAASSKTSGDASGVSRMASPTTWIKYLSPTGRQPARFTGTHPAGAGYR